MAKSILAATVVAVLMVAGVLYVINDIFDSAVLDVKTRRHESAISKLEALAIFRHKQAEYLLGQIYAYGWGVGRNREEAIKWFRRAAYHGEDLPDPAAYAAHYVGQNYANGVGVQKDISEANFWLSFSELGGYAGDAEEK